MSKTTNKFSAEVRTRAVRMVLDHEGEHSSRWAAVSSIAAKIGCTAQTLNEWVKKAEVDSGMSSARPLGRAALRHQNCLLYCRKRGQSHLHRKMNIPPLSRVRLPRSGLDVSRLGLGLSRLHYLSSDDQRTRLVRGALELGITHFDTARLYGDGLSERALGRALIGLRGRVTIATKFGLLPNAVIEALPALATPLRAVQALSRRMKIFSGPVRSWEPAAMCNSLADSLRSLRTDFVDILFLHDARAAEIVGNDTLIRALQDAKASGKARFVGASGDHAQVAEIAAAYPGVFDVLQTAESGWTGDPEPDFTFGALSPGPQHFGAAKPSGDQAQSGLAAALARRPSGAVLIGTSRLEHLRDLVTVAAGAMP